MPCAFISDKHVMQAMAVPLKFLVDFALPPRCPACGVITPEQNQFCAECWQKLQLLSEPACATCDLPLPYAAADGAQCAACLKSPPRHAGVKAVAAYGDVTREIALKLKHGGKIGLARMIARMLQRYARAIPDDAIITPVPLHWTRLWSRRYNQSALISAELARNSGHQHIPDLLQRTRRTRALGGLSARERAAMVKGAFQIRAACKDLVKGRAVVLVDDVYTSGATTDACVNILRKAGATSVTIFCWARVLPDALEHSLD